MGSAHTFNPDEALVLHDLRILPVEDGETPWDDLWEHERALLREKLRIYDGMQREASERFGIPLDLTVSEITIWRLGQPFRVSVPASRRRT